jgi:hypothetical protein
MVAVLLLGLKREPRSAGMGNFQPKIFVFALDVPKEEMTEKSKIAVGERNPALVTHSGFVCEALPSAFEQFAYKPQVKTQPWTATHARFESHAPNQAEEARCTLAAYRYLPRAKPAETAAAWSST